MQFSELMVISEFTEAFIPKALKKKLDFSHYSKKEPQNISINKIIDFESMARDSEFHFSFHEDSPQKLAKKYSFDDFTCVLNERQDMELNKQASHSRNGSFTSTGDHNSYYSCMANIEILKHDESTLLVNEISDFKCGISNRCKISQEGSKANYEDLISKLKFKIDSSNSKIKKQILKKKGSSEAKAMKHYEKKDFAKISYDDILNNFEKKLKRKSNLTSKINDVFIIKFTKLYF